MLQSLSVKNFAIIDNIQIDFNDYMTVLTGETGAGKSLIIDAIGLLLGLRASSEQVRFGETKASIEGVFSNYSKKVDEILEENGIEIDDFLVIRREVYSNGKSLSKINGEAVSLSLLNEVSSLLGDIHTQLDTIKLVNPKNYFEFIDNYKITNLVKEYQINLKAYRSVLNQYTEKSNAKDELIQKLDFLKYQLNEIKKAKLDPKEEEELQNELRILNNHEKIAQNYYDFLSYFENNNLIDNLYEAINALKKNISFDSKLSSLVERLDEAYYNIDDVYDNIKSNFKNDDEFDVNSLNDINERLSVYSNLKRKYHMTTEQLISNLDSLEKEVNELDNFDFYLDELLKEKNRLYDICLEEGKEISALRKQSAKDLIDKISLVFKDLSLKNTEFTIDFKEDNNNLFKSNGIDIIDFLVSFNKGEPLKPLSKVASGGELSRFMLALKSLSYGEIDQKTFIFDEIDSGVSGEIAHNIALKMKEIANIHQVLCVTHLPQVASIANYQIDIQKKVLDVNRTVTSVKELDREERVQSIAKMISDGNITDASIALAKELLDK